MSADLIREMQENVAKYGKQNVTTLLMMQAITELQASRIERDNLKSVNVELADSLKKLINRTADIEVLGEWLAMGMNHQHAALVRASVNRDITAARSALAKHIKEVV